MFYRCLERVGRGRPQVQKQPGHRQRDEAQESGNRCDHNAARDSRRLRHAPVAHLLIRHGASPAQVQAPRANSHQRQSRREPGVPRKLQRWCRFAGRTQAPAARSYAGPMPNKIRPPAIRKPRRLRRIASTSSMANGSNGAERNGRDQKGNPRTNRSASETRPPSSAGRRTRRRRMSSVRDRRRRAASRSEARRGLPPPFLRSAAAPIRAVTASAASNC